MLVLVTPNSAFMQINILLVLGTVAGLVCFFRGFGFLQRKRLIQDIPTSTIRAAALGLVEVSGTAAGDSMLLAPLTQTDCYFYQLSAWCLSGEFAGSDRWKKVAEESLSVPFFLDDGTGRLLVDPKGAELNIPPDYSKEYGDRPVRGTYGYGSELAAAAMAPETSVPDAVDHFLARHGVSRDQRIKVEERCVKANDKLFIVGTVCENTPAQVESDTTARSAYITSTAADLQRDVVLASLFPSAEAKFGNGKPGPHFYDKPTAADADPTPRTPVVLMKGSNNPTFLISSFSQRQVLSELEWKTPLYIFGGPAMSLFCLWNLFSRFGVL